MEEKLVHAPTKPEAPVDSMLKDMATIILSTFLLVGWVAFIITYPLVRLDPSHCLCVLVALCQSLGVSGGHTKVANMFHISKSIFEPGMVLYSFNYSTWKWNYIASSKPAKDG